MLEDEDIEQIVAALEHDTDLLDFGKNALKEQASAAIFEMYKVPAVAGIQGAAIWLSQHDSHIIIAIGFMVVWYAIEEVYAWISKHSYLTYWVH